MTEDPRARDAMAEAAGLLLAQVAGDRQIVDSLLISMMEQGDLRAAIDTLRVVIITAGVAMSAEAERAKDNDEESTPSIDRLLTLMAMNNGLEG